MNVPNKFYGDLPSDATFGNGPFREVRLFVDGLLAGVVFPLVLPSTKFPQPYIPAHHSGIS